MTCSIAGCSSQAGTRGWCAKHYMRFHRTGDPNHKLPTAQERFWANVQQGDDCWEWQGQRHQSGYGLISVKGRKQRAHRFAYEILVGPIPEGLTIDHLCRNRLCVNPSHLEPVTQGENSLRGNGPAAINARKTSCPQGHPYDTTNTRVGMNGGRVCRECNRVRVRAAKNLARGRVVA